MDTLEGLSVLRGTLSADTERDRGGLPNVLQGWQHRLKESFKTH